MTSGPTAARRLSENKERILAEWEARVRQHVAPAKSQGRPVLRNSLPEVLDGMVATLQEPDPKRALDAEAERLAVGHGHQRARDPDYSLDEVIREYHVLRQVLFDVLEEGDAELSRRERDLLWDVLFLAIKNAAATFKQARDAQRDAAERELHRANVALADELGERSVEAVVKDRMLKTIFERVEDYAIFSLDSRGHIASWARGCEKIKQFTAAEVIGKHYRMLYPEEGRVRSEPENHLRVAAAEGRFRGEGLRQRKNGELFLADVFISPMYEGDQLIGFFKIVTDLTERNRVVQERDLTRTRVETLELESELRERFVFTLSHDLRNPLSAAKISAQAIARQGCSVERHAELAGRCVQSIRRVDKMVGDLLDASRISRGQPFVLDVAEVDLGRLARQVNEEFATVAGDRFRVDAPASLVGFWDADGLRRVLENLLANAVKYGDPLGVVTTRVVAAGDRVLVSVHNLGSLISPEDQDALFQIFHRTTSAETGRAKGWGLGLTLVRGITEAHGGIVKVQSLSREGTTFTLDLPRDARNRPAPAP